MVPFVPDCLRGSVRRGQRQGERRTLGTRDILCGRDCARAGYDKCEEEHLCAGKGGGKARRGARGGRGES